MPKKILTGVVISDKPNKTVTVMVERKYSHPVLKKVIRVRKNYNAHDENNKFKTGDKVSIIESKPFSKNKKFQVMEIKFLKVKWILYLAELTLIQEVYYLELK